MRGMHIDPTISVSVEAVWVFFCEMIVLMFMYDKKENSSKAIVRVENCNI